MTYNKKFWIMYLLITTFDMSKILVLFSQVWYPPWLILMFSVRPKPVSIGPPIPKKWWHILKNADFEVICLFSMIFLGTSDSDKLLWKLCKHHFPKLECQWVALEANSWWWSFILSIRLRQKSDVVWIFDEFSFRLVNIVAHDYSNDSVSVMSMPSCVFSMPLDEENMLVDVCGQKLAVLYFKNWIGNIFGWIFVCQLGFWQSKSQYNHCGRSICVSRQLYTWLWTKKSLDWPKKHYSYFPLNQSIDM